MSMTEVAQATVTIVPNMAGAQATISKQLGAAGIGQQAGAEMGGAMSASLGSKLQSVGGGLASVGKSMSLVSAGAVIAGKKFMDMAQTQASAETKLKEIYKSRMGVTEEAAQKTIEYAAALQKQGVVSDEVALSGAQQLATFAKTPETVNKLLPSLENLLVQQKGVNGTTQDATQLANLFGKAMTGQTGALKRVGISFDEAQEKVLKYGTEEEKAAMLAEVVNQNVGNMNETMLQTDAGKIQQMKNELGDMGERIGAVLAPAVADFAKWMSDHVAPAIERVITFLEEHPLVAKIALAVVAMGPLLLVVGKLISGIGSIISLLPLLASPAGIAVAAIAGIVAIGVVLYKNWDKIKAKAAELRDGLKEKWENIKSDAKAAWDKFMDIILWPFRKIKEAWEDLKAAFKGGFDIKMPKIPLPHFYIKPKGWHFRDLLEGDIPTLGIDWYANGAIMKRPTIFGGGEAGDEGIIPLDPFWNRLDSMSDSIVNGIGTMLRGQQAPTGNIVIPIYLYPSGPKMGEETVKMYDTYKRQLG